MSSEITTNDGGAGKLSKDEIEMRDRQIRERPLGHDGQLKLSSLNVLVIGMHHVGAAIAKNLIKSGVRSICLKDHTRTSILDEPSQFLIPPHSEERNRAKASLSNAQKLNRNVNVIADEKPIEEEDESFVSKFNLVFATECFPEIYKKIHENCRKFKIKLFIADVFGSFGYVLKDTNFKHNLYHEIFLNYDQRSNVSENRPLDYYLTLALLRFQQESNRKPNRDTRDQDIEKLKSIISSFKQITDFKTYDEYIGGLFCKMSPANSIIGAMVFQAATDTVMEKKIDDFNVLFLDHVELKGKFFTL